MFFPDWFTRTRKSFGCFPTINRKKIVCWPNWTDCLTIDLAIFPSLLQINIGLSDFCLTKLICCKYSVFITVEIAPLSKIPSAIPQGYCLTRTCLPLTSVILLLPITAKGILPCGRECNTPHHTKSDSTNIAIHLDWRDFWGHKPKDRWITKRAESRILSYLRITLKWRKSKHSSSLG